MRDFESYYAAGAAWAAHADPYSTAIWQYERTIPGVDSTRNEVLPFVGPPPYLPLWALFSRMPFATSALLWGALLLGLSLTLFIALLRYAESLSIGALLSGACLFAGFGPFTSDLALGQAALLSFVACAGATLMLERVPSVSAIWTFFAAVQPNIAIALLSQTTGKRAWQIFGIALAAFVALSVACIGAPGVRAYIGGLSAHGQAERFVLIQMTVPAIAYGFGVAPAAARALGLLAALSAVILWLWLLRMPYVGRVWKLAATFALLPFAAPFFHEHDFLVLLLPAILCATLSTNRVWSIAATGTLLAGIDWLGLAQRPDGLLQSFLLACALLAGFFALGEGSWRRLFAPGVVLLLLLALGFAVRGHAAPVWPDAMQGTPAVAGSIATLWHDELARTGQFAVQPLWAGLRLLTLAGAALLAWASIATALRRDQMEMS